MPLPSNVNFCTVVGKFMRAIADGNDVDTDPDGLPLAGLTIRFTTNLSPAIVRNTATTPPVTISLDSIACTTNSNGELVGPNGDVGVKLVASNDTDLTPNGWTYTVAISGPNFPSVTTSFIAPVNGTVDLTTVVPVPASPGSDIAAWDLVVTQASQARDQAVAAAASIDTSSLVSLSSDQSISGTKTFSSAPGVPDNSFSIAKTAGLQSFIDGVPELIRDTAGSALVGAAGVTVTPDDAGNTITIGLDSAQAGELIRDTVGSALVAGSGINIAVDDPANTVTISATGSSTTDPEVVRDVIGATLVAGSNVTITPNDAADTITISASVTGGGGGSNEVDVIDPRNYLAGGETWEGVADIRAAFKAALDAAHALTMTDANARVKFVIPSGLGKLTSTCPSGQVPTNRRSSATPTKGKITTAAGLPLRVNMAGSIEFVGENGSSTIQLSNNARSLFFIDTDTGVTWVDTGRWVAASGTRHKGERPSAPMEFRNYSFKNFKIDNNNTVGSTVLVGNRPSVGVDQPYVNVRNVHVDGVDAFNFVIPTAPADQDTNHKALVNFLMVANSWHEARAGINGGFAAQTGGSVITTPTPSTELDNSADYWKHWDLSTVEGRTAAYSCAGSGVETGGFMWATNITVKNSTLLGGTRHALVVCNRSTPFSVYMDDIWYENLVHDTLAPFRTYDPYLGQTSFYIGGSIIGGSAGMKNVRSIAIGDDSIEAGGFTHFTVDGFYAENSVLDGFLYCQSQKPLNPYGTTLTVRNYHFKITGPALMRSLTGTTLDHVRGVPLETILEGESTTRDDTSADAYPLGHLIVEDSIFEIDGAHWVDGVKTYGRSDGLSRAQRMGFAFNYPVRKLTFSNCTSIVRGIRLTATTGTTAWVAGYFLPRIPDAGSGVASVHVSDFRAVFEDITTAGQNLIAVGAVGAANGHTEIESVELLIADSPAITGFNVVRVGNRLNTTLSMPASGGTVRASGLTASVIGTTLPAEKYGVRVNADYSVASLRVEDVRVSHIAGSTAVDTSSAGSNAALTTSARLS